MTKICATCKKEFKVKPSHYYKKTYCSMKCMAEGYKIRLLGENNPNFKNAGWRTCEWCGKKFHNYNKQRKYCSDKCYWQTPGNKAKILGKGNIFEKGNIEWTKRKVTRKPQTCVTCGIQFIWDCRRKYCTDCTTYGKCKEERECIICGEYFTVARSAPTKTCSPECAGKQQALRQSGDKSHFWQGGKTTKVMVLRNSREYAKWRTAVFNRDDFTCGICGERGGKLVAHHITPVSEDISLIMEIDNGITLHWKCHSGIRGHEADYADMFRGIVNAIGLVNEAIKKQGR